MAYYPYSTRNYIPATASTNTIPFTASGTTTISWGWDLNWFVSIIEEDAFVQLRDRRLRYAPFHVAKKPMIKSIYHNTKPIPYRQTILQPFRLTRQ